MAPRLLLDENISPRICADLWARDIDAVHVRDRGMLGAPDHEVLRFAVRESRALVTINEGDFRRLCSRIDGHSGLVVLPSGSGVRQQLALIFAVLDHAAEHGLEALHLEGRYVRVSVSLELSFPALR